MPQWLVFLAVGVIAFVMLRSKKALAYSRGKEIGEIDLADVGGGEVLRADVAESFNAMKAAAAQVGIYLVVSDGFRSMDEQARLRAMYEAGTGNLAARPGWSNHQNGIAVDIEVGGSFSSPTYLWLKANAGRFGFKNTGASFSQPEPWHWEYQA